MGLRCSITGRLWVNSALHPPDFLTCMSMDRKEYLSTCPKSFPGLWIFRKKKRAQKAGLGWCSGHSLCHHCRCGYRVFFVLGWLHLDFRIFVSRCCGGCCCCCWWWWWWWECLDMFSTLLTAYVDNDDEFTGEHVYPKIDREELFDNPYLWKKQERRLSRPSHCLFTTAIYSLCFCSVGHRSATSMCHFLMRLIGAGLRAPIQRVKTYIQ